MNKIPKRPKFTDSELWLSLKDTIPPEDHKEVQERLIRAVYQYVRSWDGFRFDYPLLSAFDWTNTDEGHAYWNNIDDGCYVKFSNLRSTQS